MFKVYRYLIFFYLNAAFFYYKIMKKGPFGEDRAIFMDKIDISKSGNLKKLLVKNQVDQFSESSCSVASVVTVINGVKEFELGKDFKPVLQKEILEKVDVGNWKQRMSKNGHNGRRGLPVSTLYSVVKKSFEVYGIDFKEIILVSFEDHKKRERDLKRDLKKHLIDFEDGKSLIIAHFNQGLFFKTLQIPHISPVGGYDPKKDVVTILDVDYSLKENYQISFQTFYNGLASNYNNFFASHGYKSGGYVLINL